MTNTSIRDIEVIDLGSSGLSLTLNTREVLNISSHSNTLRVTGSAV